MFYGVSSSVLGTYEAVAIITKRVPPVSDWASRSPLRRVLVCGWALGLVVHLARHRVD